jgi:uncharacterized protein (DUF3084 family)
VTRSRVARTRLSDEEDRIYKENAKRAGLKPSEFLRQVATQPYDVQDRIASLERQVQHLEEQVAQKWLEEGREDE